jgi:NTP pyrophosphatase (non-canonical NTP hydrolase)
MKSINDWCADIHSWAMSKGFYDDYMDTSRMITTEFITPTGLKFEAEARRSLLAMFLGQRLSLVHEEVSEILGAVRDGDDAHELEEIADTVIRLFDYAQFRGYALEQAIEAKMNINQERPHRHGRNIF